MKPSSATQANHPLLKLFGRNAGGRIYLSLVLPSQGLGHAIIFFVQNRRKRRKKPGSKVGPIALWQG
jgi:hypothetical protein